MTMDPAWSNLEVDIRFGYLDRHGSAPRGLHPKVVVNDDETSMLRVLREELKRSNEFAFSVAFVSPRAIALLKQELLDFGGTGRIITSDYLGFNSPAAFAELQALTKHGFDVRLHNAAAFHPKGYIFSGNDGVTAVVGSSNLTESALVTNHEWNLKVSAAAGSDLAEQFSALVDRQLTDSVPLTEEWIAEYAASYRPPAPRGPRVPHGSADLTGTPDLIEPNAMQVDALRAIADVRGAGHRRAIVISATGTGKTILSALDVRAMNPRRCLFVVHREQILDKTIQEYRRVLGGPEHDFGKLSGTVKQPERRYLFATVQTLSGMLDQFDRDEFDYVLIDEAHRAGAASHQRVLDHFNPKFLLGMTATPERTDGFNVFELFDYTVPYEIRLNHALEADMLAPFHYYGVADVTYADGTTTTGDTDLRLLISPERVDHVIEAIDTYSHAGVAPRGLIFCARKDEAHQLSLALNERELRGRTLRTVALTGDDSIARREEIVRELEAGELDYILTVDIFNEGVDIPSVNQVIMLRQTQSAIVFVQQLGRGLRKADGKEYLVVIDFIGNYANNFLVPIALFGDESLNKESLRQGLISAEETGVLPGLSSVRFDRISQERILRSITDTSLDSMLRLKAALIAMRNRVGGVPKLWDFFRFESVDPVLLATKKENYPALAQSILRVDAGLSPAEHRALGLLSHEVLPSKRLHEFVLLDLLVRQGSTTTTEYAAALVAAGLPAGAAHVKSAIDTFTLAEHAEADRNRYRDPIVVRTPDGRLAWTDSMAAALRENGHLGQAVEDLLHTGRHLAADYFDPANPFVVGRQYSRKEVCRLLNWPRKWTSTLYGYKVDAATGQCPIFVTLHKSDEVTASTAYEDELLDQQTMRWFTRSRRTLASPEVKAIVDNTVDLHVFVKKDDAEGTEFYYLGKAEAAAAEQTKMASDNGASLDVVKMLLHFSRPIERSLFDYFHPSLTV
ncbi:DEAD/DEAH box helicase [Nocardioides sp.]|uniref:DEAD/DEAH box helicase n=1 Tax=Nocardioides sp. TaxID=35761 RepID=UPI002C66CA03|nr:DEAD/DEAH box helicase [Nocardioides sp.]HSX66179.1 DEAD/DEAH box helicase [Nocardioides sp.]